MITLHTDGIAKKAGWFAKLDASSEKDRGNAKKLTTHLATALDVPIETLRSAWQESRAQGGTASFEERVWKWYVRRLRNRQRTRFECSKAFRVLYRPDRRSSVCFHLVFGSQKEIGLIKMNNAMANALDDFYEDVYRDSLFPEVVDERERQLGREAVRQVILGRFASKPFTVEDVKRYCMQETDFVLKQSEYRTLVSEMRKQDQVERLDSGPWTKESQFRVK